MDDVREGRAFVAIRLDGQVNRQLGVYQRTLYDRFKGDGRTVRNLPRRLMTMPIVDVGRHEEEAFEIVRLAIRRSIADSKELKVTLGDVQLSEGTADKRYVSAMVTDGMTDLTVLRDRLVEHLDKYGFAVNDGAWVPHVPMTRINGNLDSEDLPPLDNPISLRIRGLTIFGPKTTTSQSDVVAHRFSIPFEAVASSENEPLDENAALNEIGEQLDERIAQLNAAFATQRRRLKPKLDAPDVGNTDEMANEMNDDADP